jgi:hypothetical protein
VAGAAGAGQTGFTTGGHTSGSGVAATSRGGGGEAQPASASSARAPQTAAIEDNGCMEWVFLEIFVALAIAVAIVWWTIPKKPKPRDDEKP